MLASFVYLDSSCTVLDNFVYECFTKDINSYMSILYLFCILYDMFISIYLLSTMPLFCVDGVLKVISYFTSLLSPWVIFLIIFGWDNLLVKLMTSRLIVSPMKYSSSPFDWVAHYFLLHSIVFFNADLSPMNSNSYIYKIVITVPRSFILYCVFGVNW